MAYLLHEFKKTQEWSKGKIAEIAERSGLSCNQVYKWAWDQRKKLNIQTVNFRYRPRDDRKLKYNPEGVDHPEHLGEISDFNREMHIQKSKELATSLYIDEFGGFAYKDPEHEESSQEESEAGSEISRLEDYLTET